MLTVEKVSKEIDGKKIVNHVSFQIKQGECVGIIGPNGAGKSTIVSLISGLEKPTGGEISLSNRPISSWGVKKLAQQMAVLTQDGLNPYPISVFDAVLMGCYPHLSFFQREGKKDYDKVEEVLETVGLTDLKDQMLDTLSGGERQRVAIAKAMVQEPSLLILDEPTTFLDIGYQLNILSIVKDWQRKDDLTILMVLHDLNLAAQFCDRLILMDEGEIVKIGSSEEILQEDLLSKVYHTKPEIVRHPKRDIPQILLHYE